nr:hypothetical protein BaRGS_025679 [Batillaria attramentaria]
MSLFRNVVWFAKGLKEYTRGGYESASKHFKPEDMKADISQRSFMITGANSGIGKSAALAIAKQGGIVHLVCRNKQRGEAALDEIKQASGNEINNAGVLVAEKERQMTSDELELTFATNTLGVQSSIPDFYAKMKDRLRTSEQGADTMVWLAVAPSVKNEPSGLFYQVVCY